MLILACGLAPFALMRWDEKIFRDLFRFEGPKPVYRRLKRRRKRYRVCF